MFAHRANQVGDRCPSTTSHYGDITTPLNPRKFPSESPIDFAVGTTLLAGYKEAMFGAVLVKDCNPTIVYVVCAQNGLDTRESGVVS